MNQSKIILFIPILIVLNGCAARVSSEHDFGHKRHNRVSVGVHGHGSSGLGALIIGGIIGAVINEAVHESKEKKAKKKKQENKLAKERIVKENDEQEKADRERLIIDGQVTKWYQLGKDQHCYEMQTVSGITDVLASVEGKYCES